MLLLVSLLAVNLEGLHHGGGTSTHHTHNLLKGFKSSLTQTTAQNYTLPPCYFFIFYIFKFGDVHPPTRIFWDPLLDQR